MAVQHFDSREAAINHLMDKGFTRKIGVKGNNLYTISKEKEYAKIVDIGQGVVAVQFGTY